MFNIESIIDNFQVFDARHTNSILDHNMYNSGEKKILYVVAGPNGSGKSTFIANLYLNSDLGCKYINADVYARTIFSHLKDIKERNYKAMYYTMDIMDQFIKTGDSLIYETVFSHPSKLDIIKGYKENGYNIVGVFVTTTDALINIERVAKRVSEGGHDVDRQKIKDRFKRSNALKSSLKEICDIYYEIDNSLLPKVIDIKNDIERTK